jgi:serine protease Do
MNRLARLIALAALLSLPLPARADDKPAAPELAALQKAVEKAVAGAESSVACILVGRSSQYAKVDPPPADAAQGQLGRFDAAALLRKVSPDDERQRRLIQNLDLSRLDVVPEAYGSGVVLDESGLVLTCAHVVRNAAKVYVRFSGKRGSWADVHAADFRSDLAVLRLLDKVPDLKPVTFGDGGKIKKAQFVVFLANAFAPGFRDASPSASWGLVSNLRLPLYGKIDRKAARESLTLLHYPTLTQIETRLRPVSGGAVLNLDGALIGLTTARGAVEGGETPGAFSMPMDGPVQRIVEVLRRGEEVEYGFLGVTPDERGRGVYLSRVADGSPARRAGARQEDLLVSIDGVPVRDHDDVFLLIGRQLAGTTVKLTVQSPGEAARDCSATLVKSYVEGPTIVSKQPAPRRGLRVDYTSLLNGKRATPVWLQGGVAEGVLVRDVLPKSPAERAQLQPERILTRVNGQKVQTPTDFYREMDKARGRVELTLRNEIGGEETVTLDEK